MSPVHEPGADVVGLVAAVRATCLALPGASERLSHGAPAFFAGRQFVALWPEGHHAAAWPQIWCAAPEGAQEELLAADPSRYFRPPYVGGRGWVGARLAGIAEPALRELCEEAFRAVAPRRLCDELARRRARAGGAH